MGFDSLASHHHVVDYEQLRMGSLQEFVSNLHQDDNAVYLGKRINDLVIIYLPMAQYHLQWHLENATCSTSAKKFSDYDLTSLSLLQLTGSDLLAILSLDLVDQSLKNPFHLIA